MASLVILSTAVTLVLVGQALRSIGAANGGTDAILALLGLGVFALLSPAIASLRAARGAIVAAATDVADARVRRSQADTGAAYAFGFSAAVLILDLLAGDT